MNILIIGGTRFIGNLVLEEAISAGHKVSYLSRRNNPSVQDAVHIQGEREEIIPTLGSQRFDVVIDLISYGPHVATQATGALNFDKHLLISTAWLSQFEMGQRGCLPYEANYILNKHSVETALRVSIGKRQALILRLPIVLGANDHSGRLAYFARRVGHNNAFITPSNSAGETSILWVEDAARIIVAALDAEWCGFEIVEGLPPSTSVLGIQKNIANALGASSEHYCIAAETLAEKFPEFFRIDPYCREVPYLHTEYENADQRLGVSYTPPEVWLKTCSEWALHSDSHHGWDAKPYRAKEIKVAARYG